MDRSVIEKEVRQSQAIEGIPYNSSSYLSQFHLEAAKYVEILAHDGVLPNVKELHSVIMKPSGLDVRSVGRWREREVSVGNGKVKSEKPHPLHVPRLMDEWHHWAQQFISDTAVTKPADMSRMCDVMYFHFECIHPFVDGNGRTGRLMRNALRVLKGLPWHVLTADSHPLYVASLCSYEDSVFRRLYADRY